MPTASHMEQYSMCPWVYVTEIKEEMYPLIMLLFFLLPVSISYWCTLETGRVPAILVAMVRHGPMRNKHTSHDT